ncbi:hypothetical protein KJ641_02100 [Patescibacteria group bacterium]|nr:hypothetical protein [Patescibacteria group bacterium]
MSTIQELSKAFIYSDSAVALQAALKDSGNESLSKIADKMESGSIHFVELEKISKVYKEGGPAEAIKELADLLKTTKEAEQQ